MLYSLFSYLSQFVGPLNVFRYITFRAGMAMFFALILTIAVGPFFIAQLKKFKLGQHIHEDVTAHLAKAGTPTMGGILIIFGALLTTLLFADLGNAFIWLTLLVFLGFGLVGLVDDLMKIHFHHNRGLSAKAKFLFQITVALLGLILLYVTQDFSTQLYVPLFKRIMPDLGFFYIVFGLVVLLSTTNGVNLTDGLDGLAILPAVICLGVYAVFVYVAGHQEFAGYLQVAYMPGVGEVTVFCGALMGAGLGFLWYNALPAQVFMGDVGSLSLGGVIGFIAILCKQELTLVVAGGIFLIETLSVILQVLYFKRSGGKRLFLMAPLHHHFELKGWPESKIIVRFWIVSVLFAIASLSVLKLR